MRDRGARKLGRWRFPILFRERRRESNFSAATIWRRKVSTSVEKKMIHGSERCTCKKRVSIFHLFRTFLFANKIGRKMSCTSFIEAMF